jgi:hypothetical protein
LPAVAGLTFAEGSSIAFGYQAGQSSGQSSISIGNFANAAEGSIAIGTNATVPSYYSVAIGNFASAGDDTVAIGNGALADGVYSVAIGNDAQAYSQSAISIGHNSGGTTGICMIAIGDQTGVSISETISDYSIFIGANAGVTYTESNSIILNASGNIVDCISGQTGSFYVAPIRQDVTKTVPLLYDPSTYEIVQGGSGVLSSGITFCGANFSNGGGGLFAPPFNVDIPIPGLRSTSNIQVTAKIGDGGEYPSSSILYVEKSEDTLTVYVTSDPSSFNFGIMWNVVSF